MWIISKVYLLQFLLNKNPPHIIHVQPLVRLLKFMIICVCCLPELVEPRCPDSWHVVCMRKPSVKWWITVLALPEDTKIMILAPVVRERKGEHVQLLQQLHSQGYVRARIDGEIV